MEMREVQESKNQSLRPESHRLSEILAGKGEREDRRDANSDNHQSRKYIKQKELQKYQEKLKEWQNPPTELSSEELKPVVYNLMKQIFDVSREVLQSSLYQDNVAALQSAHEEWKIIADQYRWFNDGYIQYYKKNEVKEVIDVIGRFQIKLYNMVTEVEEGEIPTLSNEELTQFAYQVQKPKDDQWIARNHEIFQKMQKRILHYLKGSIFIHPTQIESIVEDFKQEAGIVFNQASHNLVGHIFASNLDRECQASKAGYDKAFSKAFDEYSGNSSFSESVVEHLVKYQQAVLLLAELALSYQDQPDREPDRTLYSFVERLKGVESDEQKQQRFQEYQRWLERCDTSLQEAKQKHQMLNQGDKDQISEKILPLAQEIHTIKKSIAAIGNLIQCDDIQSSSESALILRTANDSKQHLEDYNTAINEYNSLKQEAQYLPKEYQAIMALTRLSKVIEITESLHKDYSKVANLTFSFNGKGHEAKTQIEVSIQDDSDSHMSIEYDNEGYHNYLDIFKDKSKQAMKILDRLKEEVLKSIKIEDIKINANITNIKENIDSLNKEEELEDIFNNIDDYYREISELVEISLIVRPPSKDNQSSADYRQRFRAQIELLQEQDQLGEKNSEAYQSKKRVREIMKGMVESYREVANGEEKAYWFNSCSTVAVAHMKCNRTKKIMNVVSINENSWKNKQYREKLVNQMNQAEFCANNDRTDNEGKHAEIVLLEYAQDHGYIIEGLSASRPFCPDCMGRLCSTPTVLDTKALANSSWISNQDKLTLPTTISASQQDQSNPYPEQIPSYISEIGTLMQEIKHLSKKLKTGISSVDLNLYTPYQRDEDEEMEYLDGGEHRNDESKMVYQHDEDEEMEYLDRAKYRNDGSKMDIDLDSFNKEATVKSSRKLWRDQANRMKDGQPLSEHEKSNLEKALLIGFRDWLGAEGKDMKIENDLSRAYTFKNREDGTLHGTDAPIHLLRVLKKQGKDHVPNLTRVWWRVPSHKSASNLEFVIPETGQQVNWKFDKICALQNAAKGCIVITSSLDLFSNKNGLSHYKLRDGGESKGWKIIKESENFRREMHDIPLIIITAEQQEKGDMLSYKDMETTKKGLFLGAEDGQKAYVPDRLFKAFLKKIGVNTDSQSEYDSARQGMKKSKKECFGWKIYHNNENGDTDIEKIIIWEAPSQAQT